MNTQNRSPHLTYDELLKAVVDTADLSAERQSHLKECPVCSEDFERASYRLKHIGQLAQRMTPQPKHLFRIPARQRAAPHWTFKPVWAVTAAAALLLAMTVLWPHLWPQRPTGPQTSRVAVEPLSDQQLMEEVATLMDNTLPADSQQMTALNATSELDESDSGDDFLDWIVPPVQGDQDDASLS